MAKSLSESQFDVFVYFFDTIAKKHTPNKSFKDYIERDINRLIERLQEKTKEKIGRTTIVNYRDRYNKKEGEKFTYLKSYLDILAQYIDYSSYENFIKENKAFWGLEKYRAEELILSKGNKKKHQSSTDEKRHYKKLSYKKLSNLTPKEIVKYTQSFLAQTKSESSNDKTLFWLGVLLLSQNQYEESIMYIKESIKINPIDDEYHYNLALAMFKGKRPFRLKMNEIKEIQTSLKTAIRINNKKEKYHCLKHLITQDYFRRSGLDDPDNSSNNLPMITKEEPYELERLFSTLGGLSKDNYFKN
ncbi:tetratricopeptide repeat protein [Aquimarina spinulae]|uniref:tetratricopeptide repeat protein n=1 Tax=Aquimarina spinulae TaxID=1192023 RepID=UPI000D553B62|nr:hypothetical protein [Aquimarina spinulae]